VTSAPGALAATGIEKAFGALRVLDGVSVSVAPGEVVGLLGPNGAGKSTLVNILAGYEPADGGTVHLDGTELDGLTPAGRARAGLARTFQSARLFPRLTVAENAALGALGVGASRREAARRTASVLELLELTHVAAHGAAGLPHGLARLCGLARALTAQPRYLVMDEPAAGLNEHEVPALLEALANVQERIGCGMLLIEHNVSLVAQACRRVTVLAAGSLIFEGTPHDATNDAGVRAAYLGDLTLGTVMET
jgi:ABC-type branched-subunit amino acid transport system ATPase component